MSIIDIKQTFYDTMNIGLLLYPGCMPSGLLAFSELLLAANLRAGKTAFEFTWLSENGGAVTCANGLELPTTKLDDVTIGGLLIPGAWRDQTSIRKEEDGPLIHAIKRLAPGILLMSYCTGVYLAAQTGKLNHQPATTTWWLQETVRNEFPDVRWQMNNTFVINPESATASGVNGYLPIALALIERVCGHAVADDIRRYMVLPRPVQQSSPFQELPMLLQQGQLMRDVYLWVEKTPAAQLRIAGLARHLNMTPRTLGRRIAGITNYNSAQLMRLIKLNQVSDQLIGTNKTIDAISDELGFADNTSLRRSFNKMTGMTPGDYRRKFG